MVAGEQNFCFVHFDAGGLGFTKDYLRKGERESRKG
jgi:hypothetical protein